MFVQVIQSEYADVEYGAPKAGSLRKCGRYHSLEASVSVGIHLFVSRLLHLLYLDSRPSSGLAEARGWKVR